LLNSLTEKKKNIHEPGIRAAKGLFTTLQTMCGAAPCLLEARDKGFADIYGSNDEMAGGPRTHCR
jgi:hypothetical protein